MPLTTTASLGAVALEPGLTARTLELRRGRATLRADFAHEIVELDA